MHTFNPHKRGSTVSENIKVFFSYSHESKDHTSQVLELAARLRVDGINAQIDKYGEGSPSEGWPRWMQDNLENSKFVIVVCTPTYYKRYRGHESSEKGKGVDWEGALITEELYREKNRTIKFVPVLFSEGLEEFIPEPLRAKTKYVMNSEANYSNLYDFLLGQSGVDPGEIGEVKRKVRQITKPIVFENKQVTLPSKIASTRLSHSAEKLFGREQEFQRLSDAWNNPTINVQVVRGIGGEGKTSLISGWAATLAKSNYDGASYFDWSFYSQGTREHSVVSSDQFIASALSFFGDTEMAKSPISSWEKGERLAQLISHHRTLLILDGMEPLQYPPGVLGGQFKDPAVESLLKGLAQHNTGLCVITTREHVADLVAFRETTAPELELKRLSKSAGTGLLQSLGVDGPAEEIGQLVEVVRGHALTLNLLGRFLRDAHNGDVRQYKLIRLDEADAEELGGHAFRVIDAYVNWFKTNEEQGARQLAVLRILGLFDRPTNEKDIAILRQTPAIPNLTEPIASLKESRWTLILNQLSTCGLVFIQSETFDLSNQIDTHPIIREYFSSKLKDENLLGWQVGHRKLYEYYKASAEVQPSTAEGLQPLYRAVYHGCHAGIAQKVLDEVYWKRISRKFDLFNTGKLGLVGTDLETLSCFFQEPWKVILPSIDENDHSYLFDSVSNDLASLGRSTESCTPLDLAIKAAIKQKDLIGASNLYLSKGGNQIWAGDLTNAISTIESALNMESEGNRKVGPNKIRMNKVTHRYPSAFLAQLACALFQSGDFKKSQTYFIEAEKVQAAMETDYPGLLQGDGFNYCDLLLAEVEVHVWKLVLGLPTKIDELRLSEICDSTKQRALGVLKWAEQVSAILSLLLLNPLSL